MAKLQNGFEYQNQHFPVEFGDYLLTNGFRPSLKDGKILFTRHDFTVAVINDHIDIFQFDDYRVIPAEKWVFVHAISDVSILNILSFMRILDVFGLITMAQFLSNARKIDMQHFTEARALVRFAAYQTKDFIVQ